ncbi:unnamed protein product [Merluccius merluccius]
MLARLHQRRHGFVNTNPSSATPGHSHHHRRAEQEERGRAGLERCHGRARRSIRTHKRRHSGWWCGGLRH